VKSLTEHFGPAEAAPEDVLVCKIQRVLAADERLQIVFGAERIEAVPILAPDYRNMPRLQVAHDLAPEEVGAPGRVDIRKVSLVLRILVDWPEWKPLRKGLPTDPWPWAQPSLATVETWILTAIKNARHLAEVVNGVDVQLAQKGPIVGPFATAGVVEHPQMPGTGTVVVMRECRVTYEVAVDHLSGLLKNVVAADAA
jgi:hypothetical protein